LKCPKWVKKNYLQQCSKELQVKKKKQIETWCTNFQWTSCSKVISCQQTKEMSCWQGKKGVVAILSP
jgi:hypothetical protein